MCRRTPAGAQRGPLRIFEFLELFASIARSRSRSPNDIVSANSCMLGRRLQRHLSSLRGTIPLLTRLGMKLRRRQRTALETMAVEEECMLGRGGSHSRGRWRREPGTLSQLVTSTASTRSHALRVAPEVTYRRSPTTTCAAATLALGLPRLSVRVSSCQQVRLPRG